MRIQKPKINVSGWFWVALGVGVMWFAMMKEAIEDYFLPRGELWRFVFCLLSTVIVWLAYITLQARSWENYGDEIRQWQADHDVRFAEQVFKVTFGKAMEIYNIASQQSDADGDELIGG